MKHLVAATAAALLLGTLAAGAQDSGAGMSGTKDSPTQCWDISTNSVKNRAPGANMTGSKEQTTTGSTTSGAPPQGSAAGTVGSTGQGAGASRPANMPNC